MDPSYQVLANTAMLLLIAGLTSYTAYLNKDTRDTAKQTLEVAKQTEVNTNSMKDALVAATKIASHAEGMSEGIRQEERKAAILAQGVLSNTQ